jgi:hypothetical protein
MGLAACSGDSDAVTRRLEACEPVQRGIRAIWKGDLRAPCGEAWLLEHAPRVDAPNSPLGRARTTMRALLDGEVPDPVHSLDLRPEGLPSEVAAAHWTLLEAQPLPEGFADPWLAAWHATHWEDEEAAVRLAAWTAWDPDEERRARLAAVIRERFDRDLRCDAPTCWWELSDALAAEAGAPGRRDALSDRLWMQDHSPRLVGVAGDWVGAWRDWVAQDPRRRRVVRSGVGREPATALWVGGTYRGRTLLDAELGFVPLAEVEALLPAAIPSDTVGGRAAKLVPW